MKKTLFALCALAALVVSCKPEVPEVVKEFALTSPTEVTVPTDGDIVTVEFTTNTSWTAALDCSADVASLSALEGTAADTKLKVTVMKFDKENESRTITLTITPDGVEPVKVIFNQAGKFVPYFSIEAGSEDIVPVSGGSASFTIKTNCEYTFAADEEYGWATGVVDGEKFTVTLAASEDFAARSAWYLFTVPAIQTPVLDEEGNETGETADLEAWVSVDQAGRAVTVWEKSIPSEILEGATNFSVALADGVMWVSNGTENIFKVNTSTGELIEYGDLGAEVTSICSDDAGNVILAVGGGYMEDFMVFAIKGGSPHSDPDMVLYWVNGVYGYGVNNICVKGDIYGQAVVTMYGAGAPQYGGMNICCYWNVGDGMAKWEDDVTKPTWIAPDHLASTDVWNSINCIFAPAGPRVSDGFYFAGYEGVYNLLYFDGSAWSTVVETGSSWAEGYNSFDSIEWNGDTYSVLNAVAYFPQWGMSSSIFVNKGKGKDLQNIAKIDYTGLEDVEASVSVVATGTDLAVENGDLCIYTIDGSWGVMSKIKCAK